MGFTECFDIIDDKLEDTTAVIPENLNWNSYLLILVEKVVAVLQDNVQADVFCRSTSLAMAF